MADLLDRRRLVEVLADLGLKPEDDVVTLLLAHSEAVLERNHVLNLTRITEPEDVLRLHIADSLTAVEAVNEALQGAAADIGSGAGYPGIPLALVTGRRFTLVESVQKKANFLAECTASIGLPCDVAPTRAEELAREHAGRYAVVTARALSSLPSLVELATPLLKAGGRLIALKGTPDQEELDAGDKAAVICGLQRIGTKSLTLSGAGERRTIISYERTGRPRIRLPRRTGLAQRAPLGGDTTT